MLYTMYLKRRYKLNELQTCSSTNQFWINKLCFLALFGLWYPYLIVNQIKLSIRQVTECCKLLRNLFSQRFHLLSQRNICLSERTEDQTTCVVNIEDSRRSQGTLTCYYNSWHLDINISGLPIVYISYRSSFIINGYHFTW